GGLDFGILHYLEKVQASWTKDSKVVDALNQVVVVCRHREYVAIHLSDSGRRHALASILGDPSATKGLGTLVQVPAGILNAAFVEGETKTLWLSGTHRPTATKVDNKVITGLDLRVALDPAGDQSFYFSAARCNPVGLNLGGAIGVTPQKAGLW